MRRLAATRQPYSVSIPAIRSILRSDSVAPWTSDKERRSLRNDNETLSARSPAEKVGGLVYFGRMLDKIRPHARGELPPEYLEKLGDGFDGRCVRFLGLKYEDVVARVKEGGSDEEIWQWASHGRERARRTSKLE